MSFISNAKKPANLVLFAMLISVGLLALFTDLLQSKTAQASVLSIAIVTLLLGNRKSFEAEEKDLYQYAIDQANSFTITDTHGKIIFANDIFCNLSGYSLEELKGQDHRILNSGYHSKSFIHDMWATILAGKTWHGEFCNKKKNGELYWVNSTIIPYRDESGKIIKFISVRKEITEKKLLEKQFQAMVENLPAGAILLTKNDIFFNRAITDLIGYTREEISSVDEWFRLLYRERAAEIKSLYELKKKEGFKSKTVLSIFTKSGQKKYVEFSAFQDSLSEIWIVNDLTELVESQIRFKTLFDSSADGHFIIDQESGSPIFTDVNAAGMSLFECKTKEEIIGKSPLDFTPEFQPDGMRSIELFHSIGPKIARGVTKFEWTHIRKDGSTYPVAVTLLPIILNGKHCVLSTIRDITEEKTFQKKMLESTKMNSLGIMAAGIAHEINTPLAIILGNAERIRDHVAANAEAGRILDKIEITVERIAKLTNSLRYFAQEGFDDKSENILLSDLIADLHTFLDPVLKSSGVSLITDIDENIRISSRPSLLRQAFLNLINNSLAAISELDQRWIRIEGWKNQSEIMIKVTDSGKGIPVEIRDKIMDPFFTTLAVGKGSGLGLSVSKGIIEAHNGEIYLDPNSKHTCFVIKLPDQSEAYVS